MANVHKEKSRITMDYVNVSGAGSASKSRSDDGAATAAMPGRKLYMLFFFSFGLLCILQAALNISLRLSLYGCQMSDTEVSCKNLTDNPDELKKRVSQFNHYAQLGWVYLHPSFYYISNEEKSWQDSRNYCQQNGADLIIINSLKEQLFTGLFYKVAWIGLTKTDDTWEWVDGTPLTESYWGTGEPNNLNINGTKEYCVETRFFDELNSWNDIPCEAQNVWICEKTVCL
ncbi:CD209 antigen-like protein E isoform X1 [Anabas testudineus]|uniref:C-type lectin domain-containing protein n=1 Tax=Anabas testudineus TaxID=64144 RepID=A0A7N6FKM1_ANATE|nr:CD209 antigen-like protein E isoform X1 [Anabas testudineus]